MSTIIRGGSITVDGLAPAGSGSNPVVDTLTVNGNATVGGYINNTGFGSTSIAANGSAQISYHHGIWIMLSTTNSHAFIYHISNNGSIVLVAGQQSTDYPVTLSASGGVLTINSSVPWALYPIYFKY